MAHFIPSSRRQGSLNGFLRLVIASLQKEWRVQWRYPLDTVMLTVRPLLFFLPFYLMSSYLVIEPAADVGLFGKYGFGWYSMLSILVWSALQNVVIAASMFLYTETVHGTLENLLVSPASNQSIVAANGVFTLGHQLVLILLGFGAMAFFQQPGPGLAAWSAALLATLLGLVTAYGLGLMIGGLTVLTKRMDYSFMAVGLLAFLAGPSYSPSVYPSYLKWLSLASPLTHPLDLVRSSLLGSTPLVSPVLGIVQLLSWAILSLSSGSLVLGAAVKHLRLKGRAGLI